MQSERCEGIQFGTVSDILTVSSSWQSEHEHVEAEHVEVEQVEAEKVGVSIKEVSYNDFKFVKGKKVRPLKSSHKSIVSPNKFNVLEHENPDLKETDSQHVGLGYKVFEKNILECPWKTVVKSRLGDRSKKCLESGVNSLKNFETRNPFGLLENISEENADGVLNRLNEIKSLKRRKCKGRKSIKKVKFNCKSTSQQYLRHSKEEET